MHFLTGFNIQNVSAMLTVDSYLSFVVAYVLGFAALSQIPLILMLINTIKPIPPKKLMGFQRYVILAAFILAAIISPTPDVSNQTILAIPIILMYQMGVFMVWSQSRANRRRQAKVKGHEPIAETFKRTTPAATPIVRAAQPQTATQQVSVPAIRSRSRPTRPVMDIASPRRTARPAPTLHAQRTINGDIIRRAPIVRPQPRSLNTRGNTIDGIVRRSQQFPQVG
jgi:hypothetical protein